MSVTRHQILDAYARLDDSAAIEAFLRPVHAADRARATLARRPGEAWGQSSYDAETRVAQMVVCNGTVIACYAVTEVTLEQAEEISARFQEGRQLTAEGYRAAVEAVLGARAVSAQ